MEWLYNLFTGEGIAHTVMVISVVITLGILLGKVKVKGISLGVTWILFVGILAGHLGLRLEPHTLDFIQEFGLILFVFSIGLQVGPGFISSLREGGIKLIGCAVAVVLLGVATTYVIHVVTDTPMPTMVGIMSGAVTNTAGLGAAQDAYADVTGFDDPSIALGYAVAYPFGVAGIILSMLFLRVVTRVNMADGLDSCPSRYATQHR